MTQRRAGIRQERFAGFARRVLRGMVLLLLALPISNALADNDEPPPPPGPGATEPPPPAGPTDEPPPPPGPDTRKPPAAPPTGTLPIWDWLKLTGFAEVRAGVRTQHDPYERPFSIGETRLHLEHERHLAKLNYKVAGDLLYDPVVARHAVNLQTGEGFFDLREAWAQFSPAEFLDVKAGRQILTWGTGDLLFINDLFPKDWQSFFSGRDVEYLKAPSDALKTSFFSRIANLDVVYVPQFDPDRFIRGRRISYWSGSLGRRAGRDAVVDADVPDECFDDSEWAARLSRTVGGYELAAYGYWGYWKSPGGMNPVTGRATFPRLGVYGASARGPVFRGIGNVEAGYYDSRQDRSGNDPYVNNSEFRFLVGYEQDLPEIARDLTVGGQYYLEWMADYDDYLRALPAGTPSRDERRHVLTGRIRKMLLNQTLTISLFGYFSPSDADAYLRPHAEYKISDHWRAELGGNVFFGRYPHTFFGQFERDSNVYLALRYSF